jgi:AcrR family transcriptional regulator
MELPEPMRRRPLQGRSQERVKIILDAAAALFAELGYDATTTNAIAERAGTSIGSLYRFFPDKAAICHALAIEYLREMEEASRRLMVPEVQSQPLETVLDIMIEEFHSLLKRQKALKTVWLYAAASPELQAIDAEMNRQAVCDTAALLTAAGARADEPQLNMVALVFVEITNTLLRLLLMEPEKHTLLKHEFKLILLSYLQPYVGQTDI